MAVNLFGWMGSALIFLALYLTGKKNRLGFLIGGIAEIFWLMYSYTIGSLELGVMAVVFVALYLHNFWKWKGDCDDGRRQTTTT